MTTRSKLKSTSNENNEKTSQESQPSTAELLSILKDVQATVNEMRDKQDRIERKVESLTSKIQEQSADIKDLQNSSNFLSEEIQSITKFNEESRKVIEENTSSISMHAEKISQLQSAIDNMQRYSRNFNLRFVGVPEEEHPLRENCIQKVQDLIYEHLNLEVDLENAHRVGQSREDLPRHILAKFLRRPERFSVLRERNNFREKSHIKIFEDLIPKDLDSRRKLAPVVQDARRQGKRTRFVNGDLIIEGKKYSPDHH